MADSLRYGYLVMVVIWLFSAPIAVGAQDLAWRDRDNRFEGLVEVPNGKRDYELLAFFGYDEVKAPNHKATCTPICLFSFQTASLARLIFLRRILPLRRTPIRTLFRSLLRG